MAAGVAVAVREAEAVDRRAATPQGHRAVHG